VSTQEEQERRVIHASRPSGGAKSPGRRGWASYYAQTFWLPVLGPTSLWVGIKIDQALWASSGRVEDQNADLNDLELAGAVGLGSGSPVRRSGKRLDDFHCGQWEEWSGTVRLPVALPVLPARYRTKLTPTLQDSHDQWLEVWP
jgi:hypothetical protein